MDSKKLLRDFSVSMIRHALTYGGGILTTQGLATETEINTIMGVGFALAGIVGSAISKWRVASQG